MSMEPQLKPTTATARMSVPASPIWFSGVRNLLIMYCRNSGITDRSAGSMAVALDEAMSNIYRHGYHGSCDEMIDIEIKTEQATETKPWKIKICIEDRATQIALDKIQSRDLEDVRPGGLGVYLMKRIMDSVDWSYREGGGMRLVMEKHGVIK